MKLGKLEVDPNDLELRHWRPFKLEPIEGKRALSTMKRGCEVMRKTGVNFWISSGNLLGLYRDKKLIPHDTDIDVNVSMKWNSLESNILSKQIVLGLSAIKFIIIRTIVYKNHFMQLATIDTKTDVIFDVCFFYTGIIPNKAVYLDPTGYLAKPLKFISRPQTLIYRGVEYPIPNHVEEFLTWKYGNWHIKTSAKSAWQDEAPNLQKWL